MNATCVILFIALSVALPVAGWCADGAPYKAKVDAILEAYRRTPEDIRETYTLTKDEVVDDVLVLETDQQIRLSYAISDGPTYRQTLITSRAPTARYDVLLVAGSKVPGTYIEYVADKPDDFTKAVWVCFHDNGNPASIANVDDNHFVGEYTEFAPDGSITLTGTHGEPKPITWGPKYSDTGGPLDE